MMNNTMIIEEAELKEMLEELFERKVEVEFVEYEKMNIFFPLSPLSRMLYIRQCRVFNIFRKNPAV